MSAMSDKFELLDTAGDISGKLRLIYGSGPADPAPFVLTLTPQYVALGDLPRFLRSTSLRRLQKGGKNVLAQPYRFSLS
jgi:hypothetical protein